MKSSIADHPASLRSRLLQCFALAYAAPVRGVLQVKIESQSKIFAGGNPKPAAAHGCFRGVVPSLVTPDLPAAKQEQTRSVVSRRTPPEPPRKHQSSLP